MFKVHSGHRKTKVIGKPVRKIVRRLVGGSIYLVQFLDSTPEVKNWRTTESAVCIAVGKYYYEAVAAATTLM